MTDKNEGVGKDAGRPGDNAGQKRPHATLDIKATEIKDESVQNPAKPATEAAAKATASASSSSAKREDAATTGKSATGATPPRPTSNPSKASAFFTHLAAGIVGGALALLGGEFMSTQTAYNSLDTASLKVRAGELEERVTTLEKAPKPAAQDPELANKLGDAEGRLAKLEEATGAIPALREAQEKQATETKGLADTVARESADTADQDRIGKLEERLNMLAAADTGPDGGRLPQLAAITGKIADLEASLGAQITALRKSLPADIGDRLTEVDEESEAAKSATQRFDRELAAVRTEAARIGQRVEASKAEAERHTAAFEAIQEDARKLNAALGELKNSVGVELKGVAKPADISAAISPVASKVAALEQGLQSVVKSEEGRNANAERIVLSLELGNLKRAIDSGRPYAPELERVRKAADGNMDLSALDRYKDTGVPSLPDLERAFRPVMNGSHRCSRRARRRLGCRSPDCRSEVRCPGAQGEPIRRGSERGSRRCAHRGRIEGRPARRGDRAGQGDPAAGRWAGRRVAASREGALCGRSGDRRRRRRAQSLFDRGQDVTARSRCRKAGRQGQELR